MFLKVKYQPSCPGCGYPLNPQAVTIKNDVAWCPECAFRSLASSHLWQEVIGDQLLVNWWYISKGVRFFKQRFHTTKSPKDLLEAFQFETDQKTAYRELVED